MQAVTAENSQVLTGSFNWLARLIVRSTMTLGVIFGLLFGAFLGGYFGFTAGIGRCLGQSLEGPGAWIAPGIRRRFAIRSLGSIAAALCGALIGFLTGPFWFQFVGLTAGRTVGEQTVSKLGLSDRF